MERGSWSNLLARAMWSGALFLLLAGCQYDPYAHLYTTEKPNDADVTGRYDISEQTLTTDGLAFLKGKPCSIEIRADHTFYVTNLPIWRETRPVEYTLEVLKTRSGTWTIETAGSISDGSGPSKTAWGISLAASGSALGHVTFTGKKPPYGLIFGYGDPDSGSAMRFEKVR